MESKKKLVLFIVVVVIMLAWLVISVGITPNYHPPAR